MFSTIKAKTKQHKREIAWEKYLFPCFLAKNVLKADKPVFFSTSHLGRRE
jgi:hypothetical protein